MQIIRCITFFVGVPRSFDEKWIKYLFLSFFVFSRGEKCSNIILCFLYLSLSCPLRINYCLIIEHYSNYGCSLPMKSMTTERHGIFTRNCSDAHDSWTTWNIYTKLFICSWPLNDMKYLHETVHMPMTAERHGIFTRNCSYAHDHWTTWNIYTKQFICPWPLNDMEYLHETVHIPMTAERHEIFTRNCSDAHDRWTTWNIYTKLFICPWPLNDMEYLHETVHMRIVVRRRVRAPSHFIHELSASNHFRIRTRNKP